MPTGTPIRLVFACTLVMGVSAAIGQETASRPARASFRVARTFLLEGEYDNAIEAYAQLAKSPRRRVRAACGRAEVDLRIGDYLDGISRLRLVESEGKQSARWHAAIASLLAEVGRYEDALRHNRRALELDESSYRAHWQVGRMLEALGKNREAIRAYAFFDEAMREPELPEDAERLTYLGLGFYRHAVMTRSSSLVQHTRHVLQEVYQEATDFVDSRYWPTKLAVGELLLEKHNLPDARSEFEAILEQNTRVAEAHVGIGKSMLEDWNFEEAERRAELALAVNPNHVPALILQARTRMTERRYAEAAEFAEKALQVNPNSVLALGTLAAARIRSGNPTQFAELAERAAKVSAAPAAFYHALGEWLSAGRQFAEAEKHFKTAVKLAPWWPEPRTALGLAYMETGQEKEARRTLEASFALDSFNRHTFNVLGLLDDLDGFKRLETDHFLIKYDARDSVAAPYFAELLESIYDELCETYKTKLDSPTIIELFPDHAGFSVRVTGRPFIGTVGACTGRVIALTAPRGRPPFGRFNWASVLRHEFVHTVTLAATHNRIPHWLTEGLAVLEEPAPRSWRWKQLLSDSVRRSHLFTLASIDWGFARPRRPNDRTLAYAQSEWMVEYIIEKHGDKVIVAMLDAFRDGLDQPAVFKKILKTTCDAFDADFKTWATKAVDGWGLPTVRIEDPAEIEAALKEKPDDAALHARLAYAHLLDGEGEAAEKAAKRALKIDANQVMALEVISRLYIGNMLREKDPSVRSDWIDRVEPSVRRWADADPECALAIKYSGYVEQALSQWNEAIRYYKSYKKKCPEDPDAYRRLAGVYLRQKKATRALKELEALFRLVEDEPAVARQIASIYDESETPEAAAHWYRQALNIDPFHVNTHGALADALLELKRLDEAEREYQVVCELLPDEGIGFRGLSRVYEAMGNLEKARTYKDKADAMMGKDKSKPPTRSMN